MALTRCLVCRGRRKLYVNAHGAISFTDNGSPRRACPHCSGTGFEPELVKKRKTRKVKSGDE